MSTQSSETNQKRNSAALEPHIIALGTLGAVVTSYTALRLYKAWTSLKLTVPGENEGWPFIGEVPALRKEGLRDFARRKHAKYGEIFKVTVMGDELVFLCSRDTIEWFEAEERKGTIGKDPDVVLGSQGILNQSGAPHKSSRKMFLKSIGPGNLRSIFPMIESRVRECFEDCIQKGEFDNYQIQAKTLAWNIGTTLLFGDLISEETSQAILHFCHDMLTYIQTARIKYPLPGTHWKRTTDARRGMVLIFERVLRARVHEVNPSSGLFVDRLLAEHIEKYGTTDISADQMEYMTDQIIVFVLGSHETTASTLTNVMAVLHEFPEYRQKIRQLYDDWEGNLDYDKIKENVFLPSFLTECMRVNSIAGISTRVTVKDSRFKQYTIPKRTKLIPALSVLNESLGETFDHSRVSDVSNGIGKSVFGFGIGAHACAGKKLAYLELMVSVLVLCGTCDWEITSTPEPSKVGIMHHNFSCAFRRRE